MSDQQQPPVYKIALGIEYDGSRYYGWQRQNEVRSVQEKLEKALSQWRTNPSPSSAPGVLTPVYTVPGRLCISNDRAAQRRCVDVGRKCEFTRDIAVRWVKAVPDDFHARFSATARRYRYIIYNHLAAPGGTE